jgi:hypothetical protein
MADEEKYVKVWLPRAKVQRFRNTVAWLRQRGGTMTLQALLLAGEETVTQLENALHGGRPFPTADILQAGRPKKNSGVDPVELEEFCLFDQEI